MVYYDGKMGISSYYKQYHSVVSVVSYTALKKVRLGTRQLHRSSYPVSKLDGLEAGN